MNTIRFLLVFVTLQLQKWQHTSGTFTRKFTPDIPYEPKNLGLCTVHHGSPLANRNHSRVDVPSNAHPIGLSPRSLDVAIEERRASHI